MLSLWNLIVFEKFYYISNWLHLISPTFVLKLPLFSSFLKTRVCELGKRDKLFLNFFFFFWLLCVPLGRRSLEDRKLHWCVKRMKLDTGTFCKRILILLWLQSLTEFACQIPYSWKLFWSLELLHHLSFSHLVFC